MSKRFASIYINTWRDKGGSPIEKLKALKQYFGHSQFRDGQEQLVDALLAEKDVLGVMPTGAGKSICYQLPALLLPGLALVVSPLISLMKDQVTALTHVGIPAAYINSSLTASQCREVLYRARQNAYKLIYVAPERLLTDAFLQFAQATDISLVAVDEAHCVSQWGQDFRPSYLQIAQFIDTLSKRPVVAAFTATATTLVKADVEKLLQLKNPLCITTGYDRPNLFLEVVSPKSKDAYLCAFLPERPDQSGIVYCATRKTVEKVCDSLCKSGVAATRYHAGLNEVERRQNQEEFAYDRAKVMVATNAFGMGIDKSNVNFVVHYNMPKNIESYYQEAGRAGRDGERAHCVLLFSVGDVQIAKFLLSHTEENEALSEEEQYLVRKRDLQRLDQMISYCKTTGCLRAYLLHYFGESAPNRCGNCGSCTGEVEQQDITVEAQKILSAVARVEQKYSSGLGLLLIVHMLRGSKDQRVLQLGLDQLPTYGIMREVNRMQIRDYIDHIINCGYLSLTDGEYPVLRLTEQAKRVLFQGEKVTYTQRKQSKAEKIVSARKAAKGISVQADDDLFAMLRALRMRLAQKENVPAYVVFSNATLIDMAAKQPCNMTEFLQISGVGEMKAARYGQTFLAEIARWKKGEIDE